MAGMYQTVKELLQKVINGDYIKTVLKGGVGYEYPLDAWFNVGKGERWNVVVVYTSNLDKGATFTSSSWVAQDFSINNYTKFRIFVHNEGASSVNVKVQGSPDNSTWYDIPNQSVDVSSNGVLEGDVFLPYMRVVEKNNDSNNAQTKNLVYVVML